MSQLWGGRFSETPNSSLIKLNCSLPIDCRLYAEDIDGSKAYAEILNSVNLLTNIETEKILNALETIRLEWSKNLIKFKDTDEDVHSVNERRLIELIGDIGEKLHTGRSRNDQVITDLKLWLRKAVAVIHKDLKNIFNIAIELAEKYFDVLMPGYTHMQRAQPIRFAHWILSHIFALHEDYQRLHNYSDRMNLLPLGSGALAGNPFGINRELLAKKLGFTGVTQNSMHAVGDRDFVVEFLFCCSMISVHLSKFAEDFIIYATKEFNFVKISDQFSTGSSLMPQKRNPDSLELVRGITGELFGNLTGLMMTIKGTPSTYNKDLQFDKKFAFGSFDSLHQCLNVMHGVLATITINQIQTEKCLSTEMLATDLAYYLVKKGIPFRSAHHLVGKVVTIAEKSNLELDKIPLDTLREICDKFDEDVTKIFNFTTSTEQYTITGGTSSESIKKQIAFLKNNLETTKQ